LLEPEYLQKIKNNPELIFTHNSLGAGFNGYYELEFKVIKPSGEVIESHLNISTRTDDSAVEYREDGVAKNRVVTDYVTNKIVTISVTGQRN
jgi:hypothetical protein